MPSEGFIANKRQFLAFDIQYNELWLLDMD